MHVLVFSLVEFGGLAVVSSFGYWLGKLKKADRNLSVSTQKVIDHVEAVRPETKDAVYDPETGKLLGYVSVNSHGILDLYDADGVN